jgi:hypothetical protein
VELILQYCEEKEKEEKNEKKNRIYFQYLRWAASEEVFISHIMHALPSLIPSSFPFPSLSSAPPPLAYCGYSFRSALHQLGLVQYGTVLILY